VRTVLRVTVGRCQTGYDCTHLLGKGTGMPTTGRGSLTRGEGVVRHLRGLKLCSLSLEHGQGLIKQCRLRYPRLRGG